MITQRILMLIDYLYVFLENVEAVNKAAAAPDPNVSLLLPIIR